MHRVFYLRTEAAQERGQQLLRETVCLLCSEDALSRIIDWVLVEEMLHTLKPH